MEYRKLPHGEEQLSILGLGTSSIGMAGEKEIEATMELALEQGVNFFDMASADAAPFPAYGRALKGLRDKVYFQIHFGASYQGGTYGWTTDLDTIKRSIDWQLTALKTDYIDFGFLHCIDEASDWRKVRDSGVLAYIQQLQREGVVRHIGLSSHTPELAHQVLDLDVIDMLMFSINPGYDYHHGDYAIGGAEERMALYRRCEAEGVGISVMKAFSGGQLLDAKTSPFAMALTEFQCIQYALDKPGVMAVLPGFGNQREMREVLSFFDASAADRDYSCLGELAPAGAVGRCVYCKHCHPCPAGLDVALINKYYDLAMQGDNLAREHYLTLEKRAGDCVGCGHCDSRCPFHVTQSQRMQTIQTYFGA